MSDIIVKIERSNGEIFYKCDTFWSLSKTKKEAKIHNLIDNDIEDHLLKNLLYVINLKTPDIDKEKVIKNYNNCKIGYDFIKSINFIDFEFIKTGNYVYKLQYDENENIFKLIDIKRKQKLEQINKRMEEDYA